MQLATWLTILILGPGSIAIFVWFLCDVRRIFHREQEPPSRGGDETAAGQSGQ